MHNPGASYSSALCNMGTISNTANMDWLQMQDWILLRTQIFGQNPRTQNFRICTSLIIIRAVYTDTRSVNTFDIPVSDGTCTAVMLLVCLGDRNEHVQVHMQHSGGSRIVLRRFIFLPKKIWWPLLVITPAGGGSFFLTEWPNSAPSLQELLEKNFFVTKGGSSEPNVPPGSAPATQASHRQTALAQKWC